MKIAIAGLLAVIMSGQATAQECVPDSPVRAHLLGCLNEKERSVDEEMQTLLERMKSGFWRVESAARLESAQNAWKQFVEADCAFQKPDHGGREWAIGYQSCVNAHKVDRIEQLKKIPACGNGCVYN